MSILIFYTIYTARNLAGKFDEIWMGRIIFIGYGWNKPAATRTDKNNSSPFKGRKFNAKLMLNLSHFFKRIKIIIRHNPIITLEFFV